MRRVACRIETDSTDVLVDPWPLVLRFRIFEHTILGRGYRQNSLQESILADGLYQCYRLVIAHRNPRFEKPNL
jgi:hypothetical protein